MSRGAIFCLVVLVWAVGAFAQSPFQVGRIEVEGNVHVPTERIMEAVGFAAGETADAARVRQAAKDIEALGYFAKVTPALVVEDEVVVVRFTVVENPLIQNVTILGVPPAPTGTLWAIVGGWLRGEPKVPKSTIISVLEKYDVRPGEVLNPPALEEALSELVSEYQKRDWFTIQIVPTFQEGELRLEVQELPVLGHRFVGQGDVLVEEVQGMISVPVGEVARISQVQESLGRLGRSVYFSQAEVVPELGEGGVWLRWELKERVLLPEPAEVREIELFGMEALPEEEVLGRLGPLPEGEVTNYHVLSALSPVYDYYRREGFFLFDLAKAGLEEGVLRVEAREGQVGEVRVEGNARTQERVIRRVAGISEGDFLTEARYAAARQALMSLGYFRDVVLEPTWGDESVVLTVRVTEQEQLGSIRGSLGYSPGEGGIVGELTYSQKNLWGTAQDLSLSFSRTVRGATTAWGLGYQGHALPAFDLVGLNLYRRLEGGTLTLGGQASFFYPLAPYWDLTLSLTSEQAWEEGEPGEPRNVLAPGLSFDSVDNPYFPRRGQRLLLTLDKAGTFAPGVEYLSIRAEGAWFWPLDVATPIWEGRAAFAQRLLLSSGWDLPERYLFELGGVDSVRGAQTIETDRLALLNTELRFELASGFSLALFWDLGLGREEPGALLKTSGGIELAAHIAGMFVRLDMAWPNDRPLSWVPMFEFGMAPLF